MWKKHDMGNGLGYLAVALLVSPVGLGCSNGGSNPFDSAADEVDQISASLEAGGDTDLDSIAGEDDGPPMAGLAVDGGLGRPGGVGRHHHHRGHAGMGELLLWYGDLDALRACRDDRDACDASPDPTCRGAVRECVLGVLSDAFDAMCVDRTAMCDEADAPAKPCERIKARCDAGFAPLRADRPVHDGDRDEHADETTGEGMDMHDSPPPPPPPPPPGG